MTTIPLVPRRRASRELRRSYDRVAELWGFRAAPPVATRIIQCFAHRPQYVEAVGRGYYYTGWAAETPRTVLELVAVLVSRENECFY